MENDVSKQELRNRRKGQTLAEFALTLPILLLLVFGIIEFARIFQAWVTLQNSARTAVRYATTGQYDRNRWDLDALLPCLTTDERGTPENYLPNPGDNTYVVETFKDGQESLFASWYDGTDCDPGNGDHQQMRTDVLRLLSIMDEARRGAAGLALEPNPYGVTSADIRSLLFDTWPKPLPRSDQPQWFNVMICSTRGFLNELSDKFDPANPNLGKTRFATVLNETEDPTGGSYSVPFCMLNERQPASANATDNAGTRWIDAGGPGDRVTVVVTFNHQLITPLGLAPYIQIQARRAAVNESFRASRAVGSIQGSSPIGGSFPTPTPFNTDTPAPTNTATITPSASPIPPTVTNTPELPFDCDLLHVENVSFFSNRFFIQLRNDNAQATTLDRVILDWQGTQNWTDTFALYPGLYLAQMALNSSVFWTGTDKPNTDTLVGSDGTFIPTADRTILRESTAVYEAVFNNPAINLAVYVNQLDFGGSRFYFGNPTPGGPTCEKTFAPPPLPDTPTPDPNVNTPTATYTPDCASSQLQLRFDGFDTFGVVKLSVINNRPAIAPFYGFLIQWIKRSGAMVLDRVTVGGTNPNDPLGVLIWDGPGSGADENPTTDSYKASDGDWYTNPPNNYLYVFPPNSITPVYLDFGGTSTTLQAAFGSAPSDFNGTQFDIGCGSPSGGSGGTGGNGGNWNGSGSQGSIFLGEAPTPKPTNTPKPTDTKGPTLTPSLTKTLGPPTSTFTKAPPTSTLPPPPPTSIPPTVAPTDPPVGGVGGSG